MPQTLLKTYFLCFFKERSFSLIQLLHNFKKYVSFYLYLQFSLLLALIELMNFSFIYKSGEKSIFTCLKHFNNSFYSSNTSVTQVHRSYGRISSLFWVILAPWWRSVSWVKSGPRNHWKLYIDDQTRKKNRKKSLENLKA